MSFIAAALIVGGATVIGAGAGVVSSMESSDAQQSAAQSEANSQMSANQLNLQEFNQSRGSGGSAVLPTYLQTSSGSPFEAQLGQDLVNEYGQTAQPLGVFQNATSKTQQAESGALDLTNNIFNGGVTGEMERNAAPVQAARMATARSSSLDALHKTLDSIDATQASRCYVGDSYGNRLLQFQAGKTAGDAMGAANIANLSDTQATKNYGDIQMPLQNITLPYTQATQSGNMAFLPNDQYLQAQGQRMQNFNMLKLQPSAFTYTPLPTPGPGAYAGGAGAIAGAASGVGSAATQYFQQQQLQQLQQQNALNASIASGNNTTSAASWANPLLYSAASGAPAGTMTDGTSSFAPGSTASTMAGVGGFF